MKRSIHNIGITLFLLIGVITLSQAQVERTRKIEKSFNVSSSTELQVDAKYGKVHVDTWDQNRIEVVVTIEVEARSDKKADEMMSQLDVEIEGNSAAVSMRTVLDGSISNGRNEDFKVNYMIKAPAKNPYNIENKYGSVYVGDHSGKANYEVKYGQLKLREQTGKTRIYLGYGDGDIGSIGSGTLVLAYSNMEVEKVGDMEIYSKYSKLDIEETGELDLENKYGQVRIEKTVSVRGEVKYGGLKIEHVKKGLDLEVKYGNGIEVEEISRDFDLVRLDAGYASSSLGFQKGFSASFKGNFKYCDLRFDEDDFDFQIINRSSQTSEYEGTFGSGRGKVDISSGYGNIRIHLVD